MCSLSLSLSLSLLFSLCRYIDFSGVDTIHKKMNSQCVVKYVPWDWSNDVIAGFEARAKLNGDRDRDRDPPKVLTTTHTHTHMREREKERERERERTA